MIPILNDDETVTIPLEMYQGLVGHYSQSFFSTSHFLYYLKMNDLTLSDVAYICGINEETLYRVTKLGNKPSAVILDKLGNFLETSQFLYPLPIFSDNCDSIINKSRILGLIRDESYEKQMEFKKLFKIAPNGVSRNIPDNPRPIRIHDIARFLEVDPAVLLNVNLPVHYDKKDLAFKQRYSGKNLFKDFLESKGYTSQKLSLVINVPTKRIGDWKREGYSARLKSHLAIIAHFQLPFDYFI